MFVAFDIGGTKTRIGVSSDLSCFSHPVIFDTERDFDRQLIKMSELIEKETKGEKIEVIAGGIAGPISEGGGKLLSSPNLSPWVGKPIKEEMEEHFQTEVFIENDTAMVGLGEAHHGAGKGVSILAYITVSTGVGGVRVVDGVIDRKKIGFEPGHHIINFDDRGTGHLEDYIGGAALSKKFGRPAYEIDDTSVWEKEAQVLAAGLNNVAVFWSPDAIVLGGSMIIGSPSIPLDHIRRHLDVLCTIFPEMPEIKKAELGDFGGLYGSFVYIKQQKEKSNT